MLFWRAPYIFQTIPLRKEEAIYAGFVKIGKELIMPISRHKNLPSPKSLSYGPLDLLIVLKRQMPSLMVGPCGLLLVVSHLFDVPGSVLWVGLQKRVKKLKLGCEKTICAGSHTEHHWSKLSVPIMIIANHCKIPC